MNDEVGKFIGNKKLPSSSIIMEETVINVLNIKINSKRS